MIDLDGNIGPSNLLFIACMQMASDKWLAPLALLFRKRRVHDE